MKRMILHKGRTLALLCIGLLASGSVFAEKPAWSGGGHEDKEDKEDKPGKDGRKSVSKSDKSDHQDHNRRKDDRRAESESQNSNDGNRNNNDRDRDDNKHYSDRGHDGDGNHHERDRTYSSRYFNDHSRNNIHDYYSQQIHSGHCPPGLLKKDNGCLPPGQERRWQIGQRLPRDVIFHDLQPQILGNLAPPLPRHRYVRVASDILLIAERNGMVLDAMDDLGRY